MFKRTFRSSNHQEPATRVDKTARLKKTTGGSSSSSKDPKSKLQRSVSRAATPVREPRDRDGGRSDAREAPKSPQAKPLGPSPIVTLTVGREGRIFAAHEDVLCQAPFFEAACRGRDVSSGANQMKRIHLPDEEPEVFSAVLEYLYKGDYYPRLLQGKHRDSWELEDSVRGTSSPSASPLLSDPTTPNLNPSATPNSGRVPASPDMSSRPEATVYMSSVDERILRDTVIYCSAERYGLDELKRLSLRKQGLQSGIDVATILRSAQYAYSHTPDTDSRLRAHYLALIIRCRRTFKRSGTMQAEMERGGSKLFFDLFVAMCNHLDDVIDASNSKSPRIV